MLTCNHLSVGLKMLRTACDAIPTQQALGNFNSSGTFTCPLKENILLLVPSTQKQISAHAATMSSLQSHLTNASLWQGNV